MAEKNMKARIVHKHDIEANWLKATNFIPMKGEIIVYDIDDIYNYERFKIGDGKTLVSELPFYDDALKEYVDSKIDVELSDTSENAVQNKVVNAAISNLNTLVGDEPVSAQIAAANMIYVGPDKPADPNIKVWINTSEEGTGVVPVLPRIATITLSKNSWGGSASPYSQVVSINTVTPATKIDLQPTVAQITSLQNDDIALMAENTNGTVKIYSFGGKPSSDMTMQVLLTEVSYV